MKLLSGLGNLAGALLMTCLGGIVALVKPPAKEPVIRTQRLPHPQPIRPLEPKIEPPTVTQALTPTEAEVLAVAETVAAIAPLHPTQNTPIIEPEEPTEAIAHFHPASSAVKAPTAETPEPEMIDAWAVETKKSSEAIAQPIPVAEAIAPLEPEPKAIAPTPAAPPQTEQPITTTLKSRAEQVYAALDAAWSDGTTSYSKLIAAVRETTGKGCSKAKIAAWKKERGLISA